MPLETGILPAPRGAAALPARLVRWRGRNAARARAGWLTGPMVPVWGCVPSARRVRAPVPVCTQLISVVCLLPAGAVLKHELPGHA